MKSNSLLDTKKIGKNISEQLRGGDIVCLWGDLGAGKTTLTKGIAEGLGIAGDITSPTFTLMNIYPVNPMRNNIARIVHFDTYRIKNEQDLVEIGAEDYLGAPDTICIIEWPEKIQGLLHDKKIKKVTIEHLGGDERDIQIS